MFFLNQFIIYKNNLKLKKLTQLIVNESILVQFFIFIFKLNNKYTHVIKKKLELFAFLNKLYLFLIHFK